MRYSFYILISYEECLYISEKVKNLLSKIVSLIYENSCLICNQSSGAALVCKACEKEFVERKENYIKNFDKFTAYSWALYDGKLRTGILELKAGKKKLANYFTEKLINFWNKVPEKIKNKDYLVIPVPSHKKRIKERGYCQSSLIANKFAESLRMKFSNYLIRRIKETKYMNSLKDINERQENIQNAFNISEQNIDVKNILIVDDILTSGSTMCEIAKLIHTKYPNMNLIGLTIASGDKYDL